MKTKIMAEEKNKDIQGENNRNDVENNRNPTLQDPGAPVNDYGRASEGLMEQQSSENKSGSNRQDNLQEKAENQ